MTEVGERTRYFTFDQAVTYFSDELGLNVKKSWLYQQSSLGHITFFAIGKRKVCSEEDLLNFVQNQRAKAQHRADQLNRPAPARKPYQRREIDSDIRVSVTGKPTK